MEPLHMLREGGYFAYAAFALGLLSIGLALISVVANVVPTLAQKRVVLLGAGGVTLFLAALAIIAGLMGYFFGTSQLESALVHASPEHVDAMRAKGEELAGIPFKIGLFLGSLPAFVGLGTIMRGFAVKQGEP